MPTDKIEVFKMSKLTSLLQNLPQLGIRFYMVGTKEGLSVVTDRSAEIPDPDLLSAATATLLSTGDFLSEKYKEGLTNEIIVHVERGYILVFRVGNNYNFAAVIGNVTNLEYYLDILRRYAKAAEEVVISKEQQVEEAEEVLKKELELISLSAEGVEAKKPEVKYETPKGRRSESTRRGDSSSSKRKRSSRQEETP